MKTRTIAFEPTAKPAETANQHAERTGHHTYTREVGRPFSECNTCHTTVRLSTEHEPTTTPPPTSTDQQTGGIEVTPSPEQASQDSDQQGARTATESTEETR